MLSYEKHENEAKMSCTFRVTMVQQQTTCTTCTSALCTHEYNVSEYWIYSKHALRAFVHLLQLATCVLYNSSIRLDSNRFSRLLVPHAVSTDWVLDFSTLSMIPATRTIEGRVGIYHWKHVCLCSVFISSSYVGKYLSCYKKNHLTISVGYSMVC